MFEFPTFKQVLPYAAFAGVVFFVATILGYISAVTNVHSAISFMLDFKMNQATPIMSLSQPRQVATLIISNAMVGISVMLTGMILLEWFGIFFGSLFGLAYNGYALGMLSFVIARNIGWQSLLINIAAHAPFEFFAIFLSAGIGLYVGYNGMFEYAKGNFPMKGIKSVYRSLLLFYVKYIFPLFAIAGILEVYA